jgi:SHS family lactate transporter-like MFS transporter
MEWALINRYAVAQMQSAQPRTGLFSELKQLTSRQRNAVITSFLGWTLDAFDFFIMVFVLSNIAGDFHTSLKNVAYGLTLTLAMRPVGALIFGYLADRYGRKPTLMTVIVLYSGFELACAFAPSLMVFLILRAGFGIAMGGEWGVGSSLAMETIPASTRGIISGFLQEGYATGYLLAAVLYWVAFPHIGWKGMFIVGATPALLVFFMARHVEESPAWIATRHSARDMLQSVASNWKLFLYTILLMSCFNAFSHGTQDLYPQFLKSRGFSTGTVSELAIIGSIGAILGGISFGAISERIGRRRAITAAAILALPAIPLWVYGHGFIALAVGAFGMQVMVQGAWGVVPVYLNEMSPPQVRGTFPGLTYQLGNLVISLAAPLQLALAVSHGGDLRFALGIVATSVAILIVIVVSLGKERKGIAFAGQS